MVTSMREAGTFFVEHVLFVISNSENEIQINYISIAMAGTHSRIIKDFTMQDHYDKRRSSGQTLKVACSSVSGNHKHPTLLSFRKYGDHISTANRQYIWKRASQSSQQRSS